MQCSLDKTNKPLNVHINDNDEDDVGDNIDTYPVNISESIGKSIILVLTIKMSCFVVQKPTLAIQQIKQ